MIIILRFIFFFRSPNKIEYTQGTGTSYISEYVCYF